MLLQQRLDPFQAPGPGSREGGVAENGFQFTGRDADRSCYFLELQLPERPFFRKLPLLLFLVFDRLFKPTTCFPLIDRTPVATPRSSRHVKRN